jgi:hypothetical protein
MSGEQRWFSPLPRTRAIATLVVQAGDWISVGATQRERPKGTADERCSPMLVAEGRHLSCLKFELDFASYLSMARNFVALLRCCVIVKLTLSLAALRRQGRHRRGLRRQDDSTTRRFPSEEPFQGEEWTSSVRISTSTVATILCIIFRCTPLQHNTHDNSTQQLQGPSRQAGRSHCKSKGRGGQMQTKMQKQRRTGRRSSCGGQG